MAEEEAKSELADHPAPDDAAPAPKKRRSALDAAPAEAAGAETSSAASAASAAAPAEAGKSLADGSVPASGQTAPPPADEQAAYVPRREIKQPSTEQVAAASDSPAIRHGITAEESAKDQVLSETISVPRSCLGLIIGKGGAEIKSLQIKSGAMIEVSRTGDQSGPTADMVIMGPREEVDVAKGLIADLVKSDASARGASAASLSQGGAADGPKVEDTIAIPSRHVGCVIGKGGDTIKMLQDGSKAAINVTKDSDTMAGAPTRNITLTGTRQAVDDATRMISEIVTQADAGRAPQGAQVAVICGLANPNAPQVGAALRSSYNSQYTHHTTPSGFVEDTYMIPNDCVGMVIGKGGQQIQMFQQQSGARIQVNTAARACDCSSCAAFSHRRRCCCRCRRTPTHRPVRRSAPCTSWALRRPSPRRGSCCASRWRSRICARGGTGPRR